MTFIEVAAVVGPVLGAVAGAWVARTGSTERWRQDLLVTQGKFRRDYLLDVTRAIDAQMVVIGLAADAVRGRGPLVAGGRIADATAQWRDVLARRYITVEAPLQTALAGFDVIRGRVAEAINAKNPDAITAGLADLEAARLRVLNALQDEGYAMNVALLGSVLPWHRRAWARVRRQPLLPAPEPIEARMAAEPPAAAESTE